MDYQLLTDRIDERLKALGLSERQATTNAGVGVNSIRHIRKRGHAPKPETLSKLARVLRVPPSYFLEVAKRQSSEPTQASPATMETVFVKGAVQAGVWRPALEWDSSDWYGVTVPISRKYPGKERFGLEVLGTSMDRHYPDGTVVLVIKFDALGRLPLPGEHVIVLHRSRTGEEFEATLKEYGRDAQGRHLLWPRSDDPEWQMPFILAPGALPVTDGTETLPNHCTSGEAHLAGQPDIVVSALVVGAYREL